MRVSYFFLFLILLQPLSAVQAADAEGNYAVWGIGQKSCFAYSKARESNEHQDYTNYIKGFLTSYNMMAEETYSITGTIPFNEILEWLDDHCELKQIDAMEQALLELIDAHFEKRLKTPKKSKAR